jgi:hypothetical protein
MVKMLENKQESKHKEVRWAHNRPAVLSVFDPFVRLPNGGGWRERLPMGFSFRPPLARCFAE